jgi:hypothetical protein
VFTAMLAIEKTAAAIAATNPIVLMVFLPLAELLPRAGIRPRLDRSLRTGTRASVRLRRTGR